MRDLRGLPLSLTLYGSKVQGEGAQGNVSYMLPTWKRSIDRVGGYWLGTSTVTRSEFEMTDLFLNGLGKVFKETTGGKTTWQGILGRMELTLNGIVYVREWLNIANKVKCIYTRIGDNLLTNGSAESGNWSALSGADLAQSTAWRTDGTYSELIASYGNGDGALIEASITIIEGKGYDLMCDTKILRHGGTEPKWTLAVYKHGTTTKLASAVEQWIASPMGSTDPNYKQFRCSIPNTNTYDGDVDVEITASSAGEIYVDNVIFQESPLKADTGWQEDANSQLKYGLHELVLLEGSMSDQAAISRVLTYLKKHAWARTIMPDQFTSAPTVGVNQLSLTFYGDAYFLRQQYAKRTGSDLIQNIMLWLFAYESAVVIAGSIATNTTSYQIDDRAPLTLWEVISGIIKVGDTNGITWSGGVYEDHKFYYKQLSSTPVYRYRAGRMLSASGVDEEPWLVRPDVVYSDDMPTGPGQNDTVLDDPRCFVIDEVEFSVAEWLTGKSGLTFTKMEE